MNRKTFLTLAALIALGVGTVALWLPDVLLASKGVVSNPAVRVWMRQVGVMLLAIGITAWRVRGHADSPTLRAFLAGNALLQLGLLPIELLAHADGVITRVAGIVPNSAAHVLLAAGFVYFAATMRPAVVGETKA